MRQENVGERTVWRQFMDRGTSRGRALGRPADSERDEERDLERGNS